MFTHCIPLMEPQGRWTSPRIASLVFLMRVSYPLTFQVSVCILSSESWLEELRKDSSLAHMSTEVMDCIQYNTTLKSNLLVLK